MALKLTGSPQVGASSNPEQIESITFKGSREMVSVAATYGSKATTVPGDDTYMVDIEFQQGLSDTDISGLLFTAIGDVDGTVDVSATYQPGAVGPTNPRFSGVAVVNSWDIGGTVNQYGRTVVSFPLTGRPTREVA